MICQACRQEILDGAQYCGKCGAKQPVDSPDVPAVPAPAYGQVTAQRDTATVALADAAISDPAAPPSVPTGAITPAPEVAAAAARWKIVSGTLFAIGLVGACVMRYVSGLVHGYDLAFSLIGLLITALLLMGFVGVYHARKLQAVAAATLLARDPRPPVLYLRSFKHDNTILGRALRSLYLPTMLDQFFTVEEQLAEVLGAIGPVVAIGRPGEKLPEAGAARMYVGDDQWQQVVTDYLRRARLVVLRAGKSTGLRWEIEQSALVLPPEWLMFFVLSGRREYNMFRKNANMYLPQPLPTYRQINRIGLGRVQAFIIFEPDWTPRVQKLRYPWYRGSISKALKPMFQMALQPVFARFGVAWQPRPVGWATRVLIPLLGLIAVALTGAVAYTSLRSAPGPAAPLATSAPIVVWQQFTSTSGGFSVLMPGKPIEQQQSLQSDAGPVPQKIVSAEFKDGIFLVGYLDISEDQLASVSPAERLRNGRDSMLARLEATLTQSTAVEIDGHPGLSFKASIPERQIPGGVVEGVVYMVDARAYQVVAITAKGELYAGDRAAFLKSFQLLPRAAPTATAE